MSHPLSLIWSVFYKIENEEEPEKAGLHTLGRFESLEQFWDLYTHLKKPNEVPDLLVGFFNKSFKMDPFDPNLENGGILMIPIPKELLLYQWERLIFAGVGGRLDKGVVGFTLKYNEAIISIWVQDKRLMDFVEDNIVDVLGIDNDVQITRASIT